MKIFCDENITSRIYKMIQSLDIEVISSKSEKMLGLSNGKLIEYLNQNNYTLLTFDKDFLGQRLDLTNGVLVIDIHPTNDRNVIPILKSYLTHCIQENIQITDIIRITK